MKNMKRSWELGEWVMVVGRRTVGGVVGVGFQRGGGFEQMRQRAVCEQRRGPWEHPLLPSALWRARRGRESRFQFPVKLHQVSMQEGEENMQKGGGSC